MAGPVMRDPTPVWLKAENASVLDSPMEKALRALAGLIGADDPTSQVAALAAPTLVPKATLDMLRAAIGNTAGAEMSDDVVRLAMSRRQRPEQSGQRSVRGGVFWLPEEKSPWSRHYTGKHGYGGQQTKTAAGEFRNPVVVSAGTGGRGPAIAYDAVRGKGAYDAMRNEVLRAMPYGRRMNVDEVRSLLKRFGGNADLAPDITAHSQAGNTLPYAIQENIVAHALKEAGHDAVIAYSKHRGSPRLSEVFDLTRTVYPAVAGVAAHSLIQRENK